MIARSAGQYERLKDRMISVENNKTLKERVAFMIDRIEKEIYEKRCEEESGDERAADRGLEKEVPLEDMQTELKTIQKLVRRIKTRVTKMDDKLKRTFETKVYLTEGRQVQKQLQE